MVGAVIQGVDIGSLSSEQGFHFVMDRPEFFLRDLAAGDDRLVGDHDREISAFVDAFYCLRRAGQHLELFRLPEEPDMAVDCPVPVQENGLLGLAEVPGFYNSAFEIPADLRKAFRRAHVLAVFRAVIAEHFPGSAQGLQDLAVEVDFYGFPVRAFLADILRLPPVPGHREVQDLRVDHMQAGVHPVLHPFGPRILLREPGGHAVLAVGKEQGGILRMAVRMGKERCEGFLFPMVLYHPVEIHVEHGVGDQEQEGLGAELFPVFDEGPGVAQGRFLHEVFDFHPEAASVAEMVFYFFMQVGDGQEDLGEPLVPEGKDFPLQHRPCAAVGAGEGDHRLRDVWEKSCDPRSAAAGHHHCFQRFCLP